MTYKLAKSRYKSIKDRSFKTFLDLFLIKCYLSDETLANATLESFYTFNYDDLEMAKCLEAFQLGSDSSEFNDKPVKVLDDAIRDWYNQTGLEIKLFNEYFNGNRLISEDEFINFYGHDELERACEYCEISESNIDKLIKAKLITTKRLSTRGRKMEVDRIKPNEGYIKGNILLCCYWCNNAKTDEFDAVEFLPIGKAIGEVFIKRLRAIK